MTKADSVRNRIKSACVKLVADGKPVTRQNLAVLAGCSVRTISVHKDIWKEFAPEEIGKRRFQDPGCHYTDLVEQRLERLAALIEQESKPDLIESYAAALRWFRLTISSNENVKSLLQKLDDIEALNKR